MYWKREGKIMTKVNHDTINDACFDLAEILRKKNDDYGNSFEKQYDEYGLLHVVWRIEDKLNRLKNLLNNDPQFVEESIEDTLTDIAGYSTIAKIILSECDGI